MTVCQASKVYGYILIAFLHKGYICLQVPKYLHYCLLCPTRRQPLFRLPFLTM